MRIPLHRFARHATMIAVVAVLGACNTTDGSDPQSANTEGGAAPATPENKQYTAADFGKTIYCPPLEIRPGTEAMTIYERGHDKETAFVRQQASITKTARECHMNGSTLIIKVGISGRVIAGPKGGAGTVTLPIRVAVVKQIGGQKPLYSKLFKKSVTVSAPTFGTAYSEVIDQVSLEVGPQDRDLIVFIGFDEGA